MIAKSSMDAREDIKPKSRSKWSIYEPIFIKVRNRAIKERQKERQKSLLGGKAPDSVYIDSTNFKLV